MKNFENRFNRTRRLVIGFIVTVFVFVIGWWILVSVVGISIIKHPEVVGKKVGTWKEELVDGWDKASENGYKVVPSDETIDKDSLNVILNDTTLILPI